MEKDNLKEESVKEELDDNVDLSFDEEKLKDINDWEEDKDENKKRTYEIQVRLSEIESLKFNYEQTWETENPSMTLEEYEALNDEENALCKELKILARKERKTVADNTPLWIIIYGIVQAVISSPVMIYIQVNILNNVVSLTWINELFGEIGDTFANILIYILLFIPPIINFLLTLILYFIIKKDTFSKKAFKVVLFGHLALMIVSAIVAIIMLA